MIANKNLTPKYWIQLEQQMYVSGAEKTIFSICNPDGSELMHMEYKPVRGRIKKILAAWDQFKIDKQAFINSEVNADQVIEGDCEEVTEARSIPTLPDISYKMNGLSLTSNIEAFVTASVILVEKSKIKPENNQDFADCEAFNKELRAVEKNIGKVMDDVLKEAADINVFRAELAEIKENVRQAALNGEKLVKTRKEEIRQEKIKKFNLKYQDFIIQLNESLGNFYGEYPAPDFASAMKGLKNVDSLESNCNDHLAELKSEANTIADVVRDNALFYAKEAEGYEQLFEDITTLCANNDEESFKAIIENRVMKEKTRIQELAATEKETQAEEVKSVENVDPQYQEQQSMPQSENPAPKTDFSDATEADRHQLLHMAKSFSEMVLPEMQTGKGIETIDKTRNFLLTLAGRLEQAAKEL
jgi:hypothetical protein